MDAHIDLFKVPFGRHKHRDRDRGHGGYSKTEDDLPPTYFIFCIHCGAGNELGDGFCAVCGMGLVASGPRRCLGCTSPLPRGAQFCPHCGQAIQTLRDDGQR